MSHGIKRGKLPSVIWDHFEEDVGKVQRFLNRFISIKTLESYVHIIKRCIFIFYSSRAFIWCVTLPIYGRALPLLLRDSFSSKNRSTPANTPRPLEMFGRGRGPGRTMSTRQTICAPFCFSTNSVIHTIIITIFVTRDVKFLIAPILVLTTFYKVSLQLV